MTRPFETDNSFENWNPDEFARDAKYMRTIRSFTSGLIFGDTLDVGCGSRVFIDLRNVSSWTGLDISERMLSGIFFEDQVYDKKIMQGDVLELPFEDNSFDTVTAFFLFHHLAQSNKSKSAERVRKAFREISRVLRPSGRLVVAENCPGPAEAPYHFLFPIVYFLGKRMFHTDMPYFWPAKTYQKFAEESGFNDEAPYMHVPVVEAIYQPVIKTTTPAILNRGFIQKMTVFDFEKLG